MFIYLVALAATIFFIFGLLHLRCLNGWLQSSFCYVSNVYNGLTHRSMIEATLQNENLESNLTAARSERPFVVINEWREHENISDVLNNTERLPDPILEEPGIKLRDLNPLYNLENVSPTEMNKDVTKTLELSTAKVSGIGTSRNEGNENIFESIKNSTEKVTNQLNTHLIHHLITKETMKGNEIKQKLMDSLKEKLTDSPIEVKDHPSASKIEYKDNLNKSKSNDIP
ncbi:uncharacterized protein LOC100877273 [Megachile rotundata]|uniref:uncharacterized protein LOC100877273 n=1 Tax=Megachile rotundata TaxID=143995 RepID=UPI000258D903|nr:PREDICTED: uncharacterized protein LOC100877273 [Megachile rotundata]